MSLSPSVYSIQEHSAVLQVLRAGHHHLNSTRLERCTLWSTLTFQRCSLCNITQAVVALMWPQVIVVQQCVPTMGSPVPLLHNSGNPWIPLLCNNGFHQQSHYSKRVTDMDESIRCSSLMLKHEEPLKIFVSIYCHIINSLSTVDKVEKNHTYWKLETAQFIWLMHTIGILLHHPKMYIWNLVTSISLFHRPKMKTPNLPSFESSHIPGQNWSPNWGPSVCSNFPSHVMVNKHGALME
jgi:hypothetical protein